MKSKASPWVLGTVVLSLLILGLAWLVAISPLVDERATAIEDTETARAQNQVHTQRLATLRDQFARIDEFRAELAAFQVGIPDDDGLPDLLREIDAAAEGAGVTVLGTVAGEPEIFFGAQVETAVEPAPVDGEEGQDGAEGEGETVAPAPTGPPGVDGFVVMPVQMTIVGSFPASLDFMTRIQGMDRLYLVGDFVVTGQGEEEASGGRPATQHGDAEVVVNGYVYVLQTTPDPTDGSDAADEPADGEVSTT